MQVLVIGSGGREHALAWKLAQSPRVERVWVAPGNGGTNELRICNLPITQASGLIAFAREHRIAFTVVGPEAPLADGIVDTFQAAGLRCFGPTRVAAQLEASKRFAKDFMARHGIPTARYAAFSEFEAALAHLRKVDYPVVIKASGLAGGKGVIVPQDLPAAEEALRQMMVERVFGPAADQVVIEERLFGQEVSVLAFCDGETVAVMPPAQDHKPVFDGDQGPNTGGMGAYAPAPFISRELLEGIVRAILQPAIDGMREEGTPYVGVLYAGLMLTSDGPRVLEFNCRFGDPETQVILPLLDSDLVPLIEACLDGALRETVPSWKPGAAATVVAASAGYPGPYTTGLPISGLEQAAALPGVIVFHAGTRRDTDGRLVTAGGRVLNVTGIGPDLPTALKRAYAGVAAIQFAGIHYRHDIGAKAGLEQSGKAALQV